MPLYLPVAHNQSPRHPIITVIKGTVIGSAASVSIWLLINTLLFMPREPFSLSTDIIVPACVGGLVSTLWAGARVIAQY